MAEEKHYRHELKFSIPYAEYTALRSRLRSVMRADSHADGSSGNGFSSPLPGGKDGKGSDIPSGFGDIPSSFQETVTGSL